MNKVSRISDKIAAAAKSRRRALLLRGSAARNCSAYSLVAVVCIGVISSLWVAAMMASMMPTYERILGAKVGGLARISTETAIDYTIDQINAGFSNGNSTSNLDAPVFNTAKTSLLPVDATGNTGARVTVTVTNEFPPATSMFYDSKVAAFVAGGSLKNPFRRIEATATVGGFSRTIKVIAGPVFSPPPYFPFGAFADSNVVPIGLVGTDSYNVASTDAIYNDFRYKNLSGNYNLYGDLGSNNAINYVVSGNLLRGITIGGGHYQFGSSTAPPGGGSVQYPWLKIYDNVISNGDTTGFSPRGRFPSNVLPWNNVYGWSVPGPTDWTHPLQPGPNGVVLSNQNNPKWPLQPAPSAPPGTVNLGSVSLSGNASIIFQDGAASPNGAIGSMTGGSLTLAPGDYAIKSLSMTGGSSIQVASSQGVRLFFEGATAQSTVLSVASTSSVNMDTGSQASRLQIYYNGTKTVSLSGSEKAIVYAPRTSVYIGHGMTPPAQFYGSVAGNIIYLDGGLSSGGGAYIHYDNSLRQLSPLSGGPQQIQVNSIKALSWQEL